MLSRNLTPSRLVGARTVVEDEDIHEDGRNFDLLGQRLILCMRQDFRVILLNPSGCVLVVCRFGVVFSLRGVGVRSLVLDFAIDVLYAVSIPVR
jgi:hypothetical protein